MTKNAVTQWIDLPASRKEAKAIGATMYFQPDFRCAHGHDSPQYTVNGLCRECNRIRGAARQRRLHAADRKSREKRRAPIAKRMKSAVMVNIIDIPLDELM